MEFRWLKWFIGNTTADLAEVGTRPNRALLIDRSGAPGLPYGRDPWGVPFLISNAIILGKFPDIIKLLQLTKSQECSNREWVALIIKHTGDPAAHILLKGSFKHLFITAGNFSRNHEDDSGFPCSRIYLYISLKGCYENVKRKSTGFEWVKQSMLIYDFP